MEIFLPFISNRGANFGNLSDKSSQWPKSFPLWLSGDKTRLRSPPGTG